MKHSFLFISAFLLLIIPFHLTAQRGEKVESIKIAYLSEKLNLDPKTAEKFWPIYNEYDDEMRRVIMESRKANDNRSVEDILDQEQKAIDIKRKYSALFLKVVNNEQVSKLYQSEKEFHRLLIRRANRIENKQEERMNMRPPVDRIPRRSEMSRPDMPRPDMPRHDMNRPREDRNPNQNPAPQQKSERKVSR